MAGCRQRRRRRIAGRVDLDAGSRGYMWGGGTMMMCVLVGFSSKIWCWGDIEDRKVRCGSRNSSSPSGSRERLNRS